MNDESDTAPEKSHRRGLFLILPKEDWLAIGWTLAIKLLLLVFAAESLQILTNQRSIGFRRALELWNRWDSPHYLRLAEFGYSNTDPLKTWLYPLFPDSGLPRGGVRRLWTRPGGSGGSIAEIGRARLRAGGSRAGRLVLSHFSDRIFFARRIYGVALPRLSAGFSPLGAK